MNRPAFLGTLASLAAAFGATRDRANAQTLPILARLTMRRAAIARVRIFHLARLVTTYAALDLHALEAFEGVSKRDVRGPAIDALLRHLAAVRTGRPLPHSLDARWSFAFERRDGTRVGTVVLDGLGVAIGDGTQAFSIRDPEGLFAWLHATYGPDGVVE
jgi:hypothetical protein